MRTLAQAIVVALVMVVCATLGVCAVTKLRDAASRMSCAMNGKQVGLGLHSWADAHGHFPTANHEPPFLPPEKRTSWEGTLPPEQRLSWLVAIVPYLECDNLYKRFDHEQSWDAAKNQYAATLEHRLYHCPAAEEVPPPGALVPTHYIGMAGLGEDAAFLPAGHPRAGFFGYHRKLSTKDLPDGFANTLVILETARTQGTWIAAGPPTVRGLAEEEPVVGRGGQFGGLHRQAVIAGFADGSARPLLEPVDPRVLRELVVLGEEGGE